MYKILLADEEGVALEALRVMIDSEYGDDCDIRLAVNATQMQDIFVRFLPDITFINIQMTGVHGIATLRELHTRCHSCLFTIVSYNNRIDFGREGHNMGIRNYVKKPFRKDNVTKIMKDLFSQIDIEKKQLEQEKFNKQQWDEAIPMMESGMISEILFPDNQGSNIDYYAGLLNIRFRQGCLMDLKYSQITEHGTMCNPVGSVVQLTNSNVYFRKVIKAFFPQGIIGPILANHVIVFLPSENQFLTEEEKERRKKRADDMAYQLHRKLNLRFKYGFSEIHPMNDLYRAIAEARYDLEN